MMKKTTPAPMEEWFSFQWHITDACDQRCRHCYIYGQDASKQPEAMSWEQMQLVLQNCEDFCQVSHQRPCFYLTGGDPLLHPDFWRLAELLHKKKYPFVILGNPFHLTPKVCRRLRKLGCIRYQLSIDGTEETHDWFRREGSYRETLARIPMLRKAKITTAVMTTVSSVNLAQVPAIADAAVEAGADIYAFARFCPTAQGESNGISPLEYRQLLETCAKKFHGLIESGCKTQFAKKDHLWVLYDYERGRFKPAQDAVPGAIYGGCHCGTTHLTILPNGDVYACRRVPESKVGNALETPLRRMWMTTIAPYRELSRFEKCASCELLSWCRGCPAVAKATNGSYYSPDPQCWKEPSPAGNPD